MAISKIKTHEENSTDYTYRFTWLHLARPMTLTGTISPILAGTALAATKGTIRLENFLGLLIASLLIQAAVNMFNDYFDYKNGQDAEKWIHSDDNYRKQGPPHHQIPVVAFSMLFIATTIGIWLAYHSSFWILIIGGIGVIAGYAYSAGTHSLSSLGLGEVTAALCLGILPTILAYVVQGHTIDIHILLLSIPFSLLIAVMILSNNIRDIEKDKGFRRTLAMILGRQLAFKLLTALLTFIYLYVILLIILNILPSTTGISLLALPIAIKLQRSYRMTAQREQEIRGMKWAAWHHWSFGLLFALGLALSIL